MVHPGVAERPVLRWKPIDSSPKDGTVIDIWRRRYVLESPLRPQVTEQGERVANCYWRGRDTSGRRGSGSWMAKVPGSDSEMLVEHEGKWEAAYWMPLPDVPEVEIYNLATGDRTMRPVVASSAKPADGESLRDDPNPQPRGGTGDE